MAKINEKEALKNLINSLPKNYYNRIFVDGRGGLFIAQQIGYALDITRITTDEKLIDDKTLFVDDIECTSDTILTVPVKDTAVLVQRQSSLRLSTFVGVEYEGEEYINFSWEEIKNGNNDKTM